MDVRLRHLLVISVALAALCVLVLALGSTTTSYAGGPDATPTPCCTGGTSATPVPNKSSIVGFVYDYTTGPPVPVKGMGVTITGCSWSADWGTDDHGYFYFNNLGEGAAYVNLQLPPNGQAINPNVLVQTSGLTKTYTVHMGFFVGDAAPTGPFTAPDGTPLTGSGGAPIVAPPEASPDEAPLPDVGGTLPDSFLVIGLSVALLLLLPVAGLARLTEQGARP